ncbi:MAG TPA: hypothetical protein VMW24_27580, partial [Sedimentisphaerales bacterium]|nr:hypothetical protein [Sedimentisphaerales bacterium]
MRRIIAIFGILTGLTVSSFAAWTNLVPVDTGIMINYSNYNITFPTGAAQRAQMLTTNDIAERSDLDIVSNVFRSAISITDSNVVSATNKLMQTSNGLYTAMVATSNGLQTQITAATGTTMIVSNALAAHRTNAANPHATTWAQVGAPSNRWTTAWRLFYTDGSTNIQPIALGLNGSYLRSAGTNTAPSFGNATVLATNLW